VCYYSSWATYRPGDGKYEVANIDPFLCTHLVYAFIGLNPDGSIRVMDPWFDIENGEIFRKKQRFLYISITYFKIYVF
jgi:chitinase